MMFRGCYVSYTGLLLSFLLSLTAIAVRAADEAEVVIGLAHASAQNSKMLRQLGASALRPREEAIAYFVGADADTQARLLALLDPKAAASSDVRLGVLRIFSRITVSGELASKVLAWSAVHDSELEVRREACSAIRQRSDSAAVCAVLEFTLKGGDPEAVNGAAALREINDEHALKALAKGADDFLALCHVQRDPDKWEITYTDYSICGRGLSGDYAIPYGPAGLKTPLKLIPHRGESASLPLSPVLRALQMISGKTLPSQPGMWTAWLDEKYGRSTGPVVSPRRDSKTQTPDTLASRK